MWTHLDRVAGGGQVKGAGEKQIEIDKRLLRDKAAALRRELEAVRTHRAAHRTRRQDAPIPVAALVGYTNAGVLLGLWFPVAYVVDCELSWAVVMLAVLWCVVNLFRLIHVEALL
jgi:hypothetical protein